MYVCMYVCVYVSMYLSVYLCIYLSMYLCIFVSMCLCVFFPHTAFDDTPPFKVVATACTIFHVHTHTHTHTHVCSKPSNSHTHTYIFLHTQSFNAHLLSRTTFTYNSLTLTVRSCNISFVYASFPCALHLLFYL